MRPFDVYQDYLALKQHFTGQYDYVNYNGKVRASSDNFERRSDKYSFYKLAKQSDPHGYLISNLYDQPERWIGEIVSPEGYQRYLEWKKRNESRTYIFKQEIENIVKEDFNVVDGQHPELIQKYLRQDIGIDTLIILCEVIGIIPMWNKKIDDTIIWPEIRNRCKKYSRLMQYDKQNFVNIIKQHFKKHVD